MTAEEITCDANNLFKASEKVIKTSPKKQSTIYFKQKRLVEIKRAQDELHNRTWRIQLMKPFTLNERGHKRKIIGNTPYDRMILHCYLDDVLEPLLRKYLIYDNYASQVGKGTDLARDRFREFCHKAYRRYGHNKFYVLVIDFQKFYDNIQHEKLKELIFEKIPCDPFHEFMLDVILDSMKADVSFMTDEEYKHCLDILYSALDHIDENRQIKFMEKGIQIGNQGSQNFSTFMPTRVDTYCRCVLGLTEHGRYMDDTAIIHDDKAFLHSVVNDIDGICKEHGIFLHRNKTRICRIDKGVKYLNRNYSMTETGHLFEYVLSKTITVERRKLKKFARMEKNYKTIENQYQSWVGNFYKYMTKKQRDDLNNLYNELFISGFVSGAAM